MYTTTFEGCFSTNLPNQTADTFKQQYQSIYHSDPLIGSDWGYDAVTIMRSLEDIPKDQWVTKIQGTSFDGVSGHVSFDENGTRPSVSERHVFKNGEFVKLEN